MACRRQNQLEVEIRKGDFVSTKWYWTLPKSCDRQLWEWEERKKSRGSLCARRRSRKTVACHGLRVVEPVCHQGRWRSWRRIGRRAGLGKARFVNLANLTRQSHRPPIVAFFHLSSKGMWLVVCSCDVLAHFVSRHDTTYDQASLRLHEFRKTSNRAAAGIRFLCTR